jgi:hypothetical protein
MACQADITTSLIQTIRVVVTQTRHITKSSRPSEMTLTVIRGDAFPVPACWITYRATMAEIKFEDEQDWNK